VLDELDIRPILLGEAETKRGAVETYSDAKKCANLFKQRHHGIDGILVLLPISG